MTEVRVGSRIVVAEDEEASRTGLKGLLENWGYEVVEAADGQEALEKATASLPALVIADLVMPHLDGLRLLKALQDQLPFTPIVILTGHGTVESAVAAMKEGAYDYLTKPVDVPRLRVLIQKALEKGEALREVAVLRRRLKDVWGLGPLVGKSPAMQEVFRLIDLAAPTSAAVLITGESGTGKELVARSLHDLSPRRRGPFVPVNCSAIPDTLLESEVFGHEKGAFTGALERRIGCFELAHQGTIFLDEIAEMSPALQAKFLRILEDGRVKRLGGKTEVAVDVRVVAATNRDVENAMKEGKLREDLFYRLNVFRLHLPLLRERPDDIPLLIQAFLEEFNGKYERRVKSIDEEALRTLVEYSWPGNVRELRNTVERAVIASAGDILLRAHLPPGLAPPSLVAEKTSDTPAKNTITIPVGTTAAEAEKQLILKTLASASNKTRAAAILGISLKTLHNKLSRYRAS